QSAELEFQCDNYLDVYLNGKYIPSMQTEDGWYLTGVVDVTEYVVSGVNRIGIRAYGTDEPMKYISGIRGCIKLTYTDGTTENIDTSSGFSSYLVCGFWAGTEPDGWETSDNAGTLITTKYYQTHPRLTRKSGYFRKEFTTEKTVESATLYGASRGLYVPYINGKRVTEARFIPGSMEKLSEYQVFDVTSFINEGENVLACLTGNGWYNCASWGELYGNTPGLMMQLEITYTDGSSEKIVTDSSWLVTASPMIENDIQYGERYDARMEIPGWNDVGTPSGEWVYAEKSADSTKSFSQQTYPAVKVQKEIRANRMGILPDGESRFYDFGYNTTGRAKIVLKNTVPGEMIVIRYCETFTKDMKPNLPLYSDCYFPNDSSDDGKALYFARNIDVYICKGAPEEVYIPEFAFTGFRYVYIYGYSGEYELGTARKMEMNTDLEETGDIVTSHEGITKIWDAVKRSWRSNAFTGPMDCPTREKNFWNGDIQAFASTASWYMDTNTFLSRWSEAGRKMQLNVYGWEDEEYILPLIMYRYYGNTDVIETKYPVVQALITKRKGQLADGQLLPTDHAQYSDHNAIQKVPEDFFAAVYYVYMYKGAAEMAQILGKTSDYNTYMSEFETLRDVFNEKYYLDGEYDYSPRMQAGIILPMAFGIADEENLQGLAANYNDYVLNSDYHLTTGFMSAEFALGILCEYGYADT
ncbi:MAG: family 78 glycoside hydrolase catalytic domain, partial [Clostridia bacterium]|nr:family 78 glycoside hydrolase catalytic domain [Clostridia bacterium]